MSVHVLLGPPGTGKTTTLMRRIEGLLGEGVAPENIAFVSFTNAAVTEAKDRAIAKFGFEAEQIPSFRTIHSTASSLNGKGMLGALMKDREWKDFGETFRFQFSEDRGAQESAFFASFSTSGDQIRQIHDLARLCRCSIEKAMLRVSQRGLSVNAEHVRDYAAKLAAFKKENNLSDFTDMLEFALRSNAKPRVTHAFVDEAQDLCPLQHELVRHWFLESPTCIQTTLAGDDDQAIFTWAGADPDLLIHAANTYPTEILNQSYRVPRLVHGVAKGIITQNRNRIAKVYKPRPEDGVLITPRDISSSLTDRKGEAMALVRNIMFANHFYEEAMTRAIVFSTEVGPKSPLDRKGVIGAYTAIANLRSGFPVRPGHFTDLFDFVPSKVDDQRLIPHGLKTRLAKNDGAVTLERARVEFGLEDFMSGLLSTETPCAMALLRLPLEERRYLDRVLDRFGADPPVKELTITSMHRSKGREADTVILCSDMGRASHGELTRGDRESEHRTAYVAATRAKRELRIIQPQTERAYPFPLAAARG